MTTPFSGVLWPPLILFYSDHVKERPCWCCGRADSSCSVPHRDGATRDISSRPLWSTQGQVSNCYKHNNFHPHFFRLFEAATDLRHLNTWFSWASSITPVDGLPLSVGKQYSVEYNLPVGKYSFLATIKELSKGRSDLKQYLRYFLWYEVQENCCWGRQFPEAEGDCCILAEEGKLQAGNDNCLPEEVSLVPTEPGTLPEADGQPAAWSVTLGVTDDYKQHGIMRNSLSSHILKNKVQNMICMAPLKDFWQFDPDKALKL